MKSSGDISRALRYVKSLLKNKLPDNMHYHDIRHTVDVYTSAMRYGKMEGLGKRDVELLGIAGIFHDTGYIERYEKNEPFGARIAQRYMKTEGFAKNEIVKVKALIMATQMPQRPKNAMQRIMCDADLDNVGRSDFFARGDLLRKELEARRGKEFSDDEWNKIQMNFITSHRYFTKSARKMRDAGKRRNIARLGKLLGLKRGAVLTGTRKP